MYCLDIRKRVRDDFDAYRIDESTVDGNKCQRVFGLRWLLYDLFHGGG